MYVYYFTGHQLFITIIQLSVRRPLSTIQSYSIAECFLIEIDDGDAITI